MILFNKNIKLKNHVSNIMLNKIRNWVFSFKRILCLLLISVSVISNITLLFTSKDKKMSLQRFCKVSFYMLISMHHDNYKYFVQLLCKCTYCEYDCCLTIRYFGDRTCRLPLHTKRKTYRFIFSSYNLRDNHSPEVAYLILHF